MTREFQDKGSALLMQLCALESILGEIRYRIHQRNTTDFQALKRNTFTDAVSSALSLNGTPFETQEIWHLCNRSPDYRVTSWDEQEAAGYADALEYVLTQLSFHPISTAALKRLHIKLLSYLDTESWHRGEFRRMGITNDWPNGIKPTPATGIVEPEQVPFQTDRLLMKVEQQMSESKKHPVFIIAEFLEQFFKISPFQEGNGPVACLMINALMIKAGYSQVQFFPVESAIQGQRNELILLLENQSGSPEGESFTEKWAEWLLKVLITHAGQVRILLDKEPVRSADLPPLSSRIMALLEKENFVTVRAIVKETGGNRNTIKKHLEMLTRGGYLNKQGTRKGTWYTPIQVATT